MRESIRPRPGTGLALIPQSCLTALAQLPVRLLALPVIWLLMHFRRYVRLAIS
jgi:hypothetical protein